MERNTALHWRQLLQEDTRVQTDPEKYILPMDSDNGIVTNMLKDNLLDTWQLFEMMQINSKGAFTMEDFFEQLRMRIEIDSKTMFRPDSTQDEFFSHIAQISQCDHCGTGTSPKSPKMLTCSACKSVHYCHKECQRQHWKNGHKALCMGKTVQKDVFRVAYFCSKMLSFLSMGLDAEQETVIGADSSYLHTAILKSGCKDHIYMPAFDEGTLMYIPMPLKFVAYLSLGYLKGTGLNSFNDRGQYINMIIQTNIPIDKNTCKEVVFIMTETHVRLP